MVVIRLREQHRSSLISKITITESTVVADTRQKPYRQSQIIISKDFEEQNLV